MKKNEILIGAVIILLIIAVIESIFVSTKLVISSITQVSLPLPTPTTYYQPLVNQHWLRIIQDIPKNPGTKASFSIETQLTVVSIRHDIKEGTMVYPLAIKFKSTDNQTSTQFYSNNDIKNIKVYKANTSDDKNALTLEDLNAGDRLRMTVVYNLNQSASASSVNQVFIIY